MGSEIELSCDNCGKSFLRKKSEYNRSKRLGRKSFCSRFCQRQHAHVQGSYDQNKKDFKLIHANHGWDKTDEYTPFRYYIKTMKARYKSTHKNRGNDCSLTLDYIKNLWESQEGICPYTGWKMLLPETVEGWRDGVLPSSASLDRIDSNEGYIKGNVEFVCYMANMAKNMFNREDVIKFCKSVASHHVTKTG